MRRILAILILFWSIQNGHCQDWDNYESFYSSGEIPVEFIESYSNKYDNLAGEIDSDDNTRILQEQTFYRKTQYFVDQLLISGQVTFGDSITNYCNKVLDHLLKDEPALRSQLRIYTIKTTEFNAYATSGGIIFVTTGLLSEIENEAQLAFILAHEVIHYRENHVLDQYLETDRAKAGKDTYKRKSLDDRLASISAYSKAQELEADSSGFYDYYLNSGYDPVEAVYLMDIMLYSYLPFDELEFDINYLSSATLKFDEELLLEEVAPITLTEDYDDSESSHPNIKKRREKIEDIIRAGGKEKYIVSQSSFEYCQRLARYEGCRLNLIDKNIPEVIYITYLLKEHYGEDLYQRKMVSKALQTACSMRHESDYFSNVPDYRDIEGESQQVYYMMEEFEVAELNTLAVSYAYETYKLDDTSRDMYLSFRHALFDLVMEENLSKDHFYKNAFQPTDSISGDSLASANLWSDTLSLENRSSKIQRIKARKAIEVPSEPIKKEDIDRYRYAFVEYLNDSIFDAVFNEFDDLHDDGYQKPYYKSNPNQYSRFDKNTALGIDSVLLITPAYLAIDETKEISSKFLYSDERQGEYSEMHHDIANKIGLNLEELDYKGLTANDCERFNDLAILNDWIQERFEIGNTGARNTDYENIELLREKYGLDYIIYTGNISAREKEEKVAQKIALGVFTVVYLPFAIASVIQPDFESFNYFFLFDLKDGDALLAEYNYYSTKDRNDYLKSIIYNNLIQVKAE